MILEIVDAPVRRPAELHSGGPSFSMIPRGCRNCGYPELALQIVAIGNTSQGAGEIAKAIERLAEMESAH